MWFVSIVSYNLQMRKQKLREGIQDLIANQSSGLEILILNLVFLPQCPRTHSHL